MEWSEGDIWATTVDLPAGDYEFKLVVAAPDNSIWEDGPNRILSLSSSTGSSSSSYLMACDWGSPESATLQVTSPEASTPAAAGEEESVVEVGKLTIDGAIAAAEGMLATAVGKMTIEGGEEENNNTSDVVEIGKMTVPVGSDKDLGVGAEEGLQAAEAMLPDVAAVVEEEDLGTAISKMMSGFLKVRICAYLFRYLKRGRDAGMNE